MDRRTLGHGSGAAVLALLLGAVPEKSRIVDAAAVVARKRLGLA